MREKGFQIYEFVIMLNHLHLTVASDKVPLSDITCNFKKFTAKKIIEAIAIGNESRKEWMLKKFFFAGSHNSNNTIYQFWQQDDHAVELSTKTMWDQRVQYIHNNPVRAGIIENIEDYVYSSARFYYGKKCLLPLSSV